MKKLFTVLGMMALAATLVACGNAASKLVEKVAITYAGDDKASAVTKDLGLPIKLTENADAKVAWTSSNVDVIKVEGDKGIITRPAANTKVKLSFEVTVKDATATGSVEVTVIKKEEVIIITVADVATEQELLSAIAKPEIKTINLTADIALSKKVAVELKDGLTIDGKGKKLSLTNVAGWDADYVLHIYRSKNVVIKDIELTGGDAGLLVNASVVTLEGTIKLGGNEFGGIEISKGKDGAGVVLTDEVKLDITKTTLVNSDEKATNPTVWYDQITEGLVEGTTKLVKVTEGVPAGQTYFFVVNPA